MAAFFLRTGKFSHNALFSDIEIRFLNPFFISNSLKRTLLLVNDLIEDHFQILVGRVPLLFNVLDLRAQFGHLVILLSHPHELSFHAVVELLLLEQKSAVVKRTGFVEICLHHVIFIFLTHRVLIVVFKKDLTLSFEFLEVVKKRFVDLLNTIDDDRNKDVVRVGTLLDQEINIIRDPLESPL